MPRTEQHSSPVMSSGNGSAAIRAYVSHGNFPATRGAGHQWITLEDLPNLSGWCLGSAFESTNRQKSLVAVDTGEAAGIRPLQAIANRGANTDVSWFSQRVHPGHRWQQPQRGSCSVSSPGWKWGSCSLLQQDCRGCQSVSQVFVLDPPVSESSPTFTSWPALDSPETALFETEIEWISEKTHSAITC